MESLHKLKITSLDEDDDDEVEQQQIIEQNFDDDDEEEEEEVAVTLGFVEKPKHRFSLLRQLFPSKAGGAPAWLDPVNLPSGRCCACDICGEPLQFLLQVYAPVLEKESTFHRTLFVLMCTKMSCLFRDQHEQWKRKPEIASRSVKVFRCQLFRSNPFYSSEPPEGDGTDEPSGSGAALCNWCGTWKGDKVCGRCKRARYCSKSHQDFHWRSGHKNDCQHLSLSPQLQDSNSLGEGKPSVEVTKVASNHIWPEYEIVNEDESEYNDETSGDNELSKSLVSRTKVEETLNSMLDSFEGDSDKKCWVTFQERIARAPEQVLRYCRKSAAKPLWPKTSGQPSKADIPNCSYCGGPSVFEFQILPQLLYYFGVKNDDVESVDWATIVVYTCEASCEASLSYKEEFAWVQLY